MSKGEGAKPLNEPRSNAEVLSFDQIYEQYFDLVWSTTRRFGIASEAMDDVVQEIFMVIHSRLNTLEKPEALRSWIYGIVRRKVSGYRRKRQLEKYSSVSVENVADDVFSRSPGDLAERNEQVRKLWAILEAMEPVKREVFIMAELDELTCPEIAEILSIPLNTAYSRLRHAREAFDAALMRRNLQPGVLS